MGEVSVINFVVKVLNNNRNVIGQNGLKSLDKVARRDSVEKSECRELKHIERRGIKGEEKRREREVCRELREKEERKERGRRENPL